MKLSSRRLFLAILLLLPFVIFWRNFTPGMLVNTSDANIAGFAISHEQLREGWRGCWSSTWWLGFGGATPMLRVESVLLWLLPPVLYAKISIPLFLAMGGLSAFAFARAVGFSEFVVFTFALGWELVGSSLTDIPGGHHSRQLMFGVLPLMYLGLWRAAKYGSMCGVVLAAAVVATMMQALTDSGAMLAMSGVAFFVWLSRSRLAQTRFWIQAAVGTSLTLVLLAQVLFSAIPALTSGLDVADPELAEIPPESNNWGWHTQWSFAPEEILELVAPGMFGWQSGDSSSPYWGRVGQSEEWHESQQGFRNFRIDNPTTGTAVAALAVLGIWGCWRRRKPLDPGSRELAAMARFFTVVGAVTLLLSLGKYLPGYRLLFELPGFHSWRNPNKFFFVTSFCLVFCAGYGAQLLFRAVTSKPDAARELRLWARKGAWVLMLTGVGIFAAALLSLFFRDEIVMTFAENTWTPEEAAVHATTILLALLRGSVMWLLWGGFVWLALRWSVARPHWLPWLGGAWAVLLVCEMWFVASHYLDFFNYKAALAPHPMLQRIIDDQKKEPSRFKMLVTDQLLNSFYFFQIPYHRLQSMNIPASSRTPADYRYYLPLENTHPVLFWELSNVKYVLAQKDLARDFQARYANRFDAVTDFAIEQHPTGYEVHEVSPETRGGVYRLLRVRHPLTRALVVPQLRVVPTKEELLSIIKTGQNDFEKTMLVFPSAGVRQRSGPPAGKYSASVTEYGGNRIVVEAVSDQPAFLLFNDRYDPDWKATVNGKPAKLFRANFMVRGVEIPAGESKIVFTYELDRGLFFFTLWAWLLLIVFGCVFCLFRRKGSRTS